ncbi:MAG: GHKL domain-containing protein [Clostridia bacterium]|nr:GHKL domain-containing protein [Clostridia bacterium]
MPLRVSFIAAMTGLCIQACIKSVFIHSLSYWQINSNLISKESQHYLSFSLLEDCVLIAVIILLNKSNYKIIDLSCTDTKKTYTITGINKSFPFISMFFGQVIMILLLYLGDYPGSHYPPPQVSKNIMPKYIVIIIALLPVLTILATKRIITYIQNEMNYKIKMESLIKVEELIKNIHIQQHDFKHEMQVVYGLLQLGAFNEAKEYIGKSMAEISLTSEILKTDDISLTALLYVKTCIAKVHRVLLEFDVRVRRSDIAVEDNDMHSILGNLIDNAIEAVKDQPLEKRKVNLNIYKDDENVYFEVGNYGKPIRPSIKNRIFCFGFSSKKKGRGIGLYSIGKLVRKYQGKIQLIHRDKKNYFIVSIPKKSDAWMGGELCVKSYHS